MADYGTRLKATFNNVPAGVRIFVSTSNVNNAASFVPAPAVVGGSAANANNPQPAILVMPSSSTVKPLSDGNAGTSGFFPSVPATDNGPSGGNVPIAEVSIANGTGTAVWEAVNTNPNTIESFKFAVYTTYIANVAQNTPLPGSATVNLSFAPTATSGVASSTLTIPRFAGDSLAARALFTINICRTILLYPYITNQAGFDTGLTVANTSQDSFTTGSNATGAQSGSCVLTWYGGTTSAPTTAPAPFNTGTIAAGATFANTVSTMAPGFQGYMFAVCNFQFAHGFAFISDVGARNLAMGYLAVVINDPGTGTTSERQYDDVRKRRPLETKAVDSTRGEGFGSPPFFVDTGIAESARLKFSRVHPNPTMFLRERGGSLGQTQSNVSHGIFNFDSSYAHGVRAGNRAKRADHLRQRPVDLPDLRI